MNEDLRYPIGEFKYRGPASAAERQRFIADIAAAPTNLRAALQGLSAQQLDTPYRPGGWTLRQVAHHVPDSHLNAYVRCKLALTEERPTIRPYDEQRWAETADVRDTPVEVSLALLEALHARWTVLLRGLPEAAWSRQFNHPERGVMTLDELLALYSWHGSHHCAHVTRLRERMGW